jgi:hypothetical protein
MNELYEELSTAILGISPLVRENIDPIAYNAFWIDQSKRPKNFANVYPAPQAGHFSVWIRPGGGVPPQDGFIEVGGQQGPWTSSAGSCPLVKMPKSWSPST